MRLYPLSRLQRLLTVFITLLVAGIVFSAVVPKVRADSIYLIPDTLGSTAAYAMALNDGNPVLAYYSATTSTIVVAICDDPSCRTDLTVIRPIEAKTISAIAVTVITGNPFIVYSANELPGGGLRVAACVDPTCSQPPVITLIENAGVTDIALTLQNGKVLIAYVRSSQSTSPTKLAICNDAACTAPTMRSFSGTGSATSGVGVGLGILNGNPVIAYASGLTARMLLCLSPNCAETPSVKTVDSGYSAISGIALTVSDTTPVITYIAQDTYYDWLKVATCTDPACNDPIYTHIVDTSLYYYHQTSVSMANGLPMIAYYHHGIRLATCLDIMCNYASSTVIADENHIQPVIEVNQNVPTVSFLQITYPPSSTELIKVYYGGDTHPPESPTPSITPTETVAVTLTFPVPTATSTLPTITPSITPTPSFTFTPSNTPTHTPTPITPTSPANAHPIPNYSTSDKVTLTWNRVAGASGYQVELDDAPDFIIPLDTQDLSADILQHTTGSLDNGTYYWRICAKNGSDVCGAWSVTQSFVISAEP